jgi:hypothetical protein
MISEKKSVLGITISDKLGFRKLNTIRDRIEEWQNNKKKKKKTNY